MRRLTLPAQASPMPVNVPLWVVTCAVTMAMPPLPSVGICTISVRITESPSSWARASRPA